MLESVVLIVIALLFSIPIVNVSAHMICDIYFAKKGKYQRALLNELNKEGEKNYGPQA